MMVVVVEVLGLLEVAVLEVGQRGHCSLGRKSMWRRQAKDVRLLGELLVGPLVGSLVGSLMGRLKVVVVLVVIVVVVVVMVLGQVGELGAAGAAGGRAMQRAVQGAVLRVQQGGGGGGGRLVAREERQGVQPLLQGVGGQAAPRVHAAHGGQVTQRHVPSHCLTVSLAHSLTNHSHWSHARSLAAAALGARRYLHSQWQDSV